MGRNLLNSSTSLTQTGPVTRPFGTGTVRFFTSSASWVVPPGITTVRARVWGGGANGNRTSGKNVTGSSGGGGGFAMRVITGLTPGSTVTITVPAVSTTAGAAGGTCSFGAFVSATGGTSGGSGGSGSSGDVNFTGGSGSSASNNDTSGGGGVANLFGNGGNGAGSIGVTIRPMTSAASGGGGGNSSAGAEHGGNSLFARGGITTTFIISGSAFAGHPGYAPTSGNENNQLDFIGVGGGGGAGSGSGNFYRGQDGVNGGGGGSRAGSGGFPGGGAGAPISSTYSLGAPGLVVVEW